MRIGIHTRLQQLETDSVLRRNGVSCLAICALILFFSSLVRRRKL